MTRAGWSHASAIAAAWIVALAIGAVALGLLSLLKEGGVASERLLAASHRPLPRGTDRGWDEEPARVLYQPDAPWLSIACGPDR